MLTGQPQLLGVHWQGLPEAQSSWLRLTLSRNMKRETSVHLAPSSHGSMMCTLKILLKRPTLEFLQFLSQCQLQQKHLCLQPLSQCQLQQTHLRLTGFP